MRKFRKSFFIAGLASLSIFAALLSGCDAASVPVAAAQSQSSETSTSVSAQPQIPESTSSIPVQSQDSYAALSGDKTVTVSASGKVSVVPDMAEIIFGISTEDTDAAAAQDKNSKEAQKVVDKLTELGISEKSIKTSAYDIYPQYDYDAEGGSRIVGYTVDTTLTVSDLPVSDAGNVISQCVSAGINSMNGINYSCSGYDDAYNEALAEAVNAAAGKAQVLATAFGKSLGDVKSVVEGYQDVTLQYRSLDAAAFKNSMESSDAVIMPGESDVEAQVTVTYALN